jgi:hypothetical protein
LATYWNWWTRDPTKDRKRVLWVCGSQTFLVEDFLQEYPRRRFVPTVERLTGDDPELWEALAQDGLAGAGTPVLFLVRAAETVPSWEPLAGFLGRLTTRPGVHVIWVGGTHAWAADEEGRPLLDGERKKMTLPYVKQIENRTFGETIICESTTEEKTIDWLIQRSRGQLSKWDARFLIQRAGGEVRQAAQAVALLRAVVAPDKPFTHAMIEAVTTEYAARDLVAHLTRLERQEARMALAAEHPDVAEARVMLMRLSRNLDALVLLAAAHAQRLTKAEAMGRPELPKWAVMVYWDVAGSGYTGRDVLRRRMLLRELDEALADWQYADPPTGLMESLVALW